MYSLPIRCTGWSSTVRTRSRPRRSSHQAKRSFERAVGRDLPAGRRCGCELGSAVIADRDDAAGARGRGRRKRQDRRSSRRFPCGVPRVVVVDGKRAAFPTPKILSRSWPSPRSVGRENEQKGVERERIQLTVDRFPVNIHHAGMDRSPCPHGAGAGAAAGSRGLPRQAGVQHHRPGGGSRAYIAARAGCAADR
jgi:hypothetical protein